jgi:hypothetical protein
VIIRRGCRWRSSPISASSSCSSVCQLHRDHILTRCCRSRGLRAHADGVFDGRLRTPRRAGGSGAWDEVSRRRGVGRQCWRGVSQAAARTRPCCAGRCAVLWCGRWLGFVNRAVVRGRRRGERHCLLRTRLFYLYPFVVGLAETIPLRPSHYTGMGDRYLDLTEDLST